MKGRYKAFWWSLFAIGGMVSAMLYPAHMLVTMLLGPAGVVEMPTWEQAHALFSHPLFRIYLVVLIALPLFHAAHRVMAAFMDFGLRGPFRNPTAMILYGAATAVAAFTIFTMVRMM
ncbi:MAG: hypothetical protein OER88_10765 [Planctomycetota bacterium]|nr:hypothetical protein [Planctomycetota bacterium]